MVRYPGSVIALGATLGLMIALVHPNAHAQSGDAPEVIPSGTTGSVLFKPLPDSISNPGGAHYFWRFPKVPATDVLTLDDFLVVLISTGSSTVPARTKTVRVGGYESTPSTVAVPPGSILTFISDGPVPYKLDIIGRSMDPVELSGSLSKSDVTLEKLGRYVFQDRISTSVVTWVIVGSVIADSTLVPVSNQEATFNFGKVRPGQYRLRVYFRGENLTSLEREVTVDDGGLLAPSKTLLSSEDLANLTD